MPKINYTQAVPEQEIVTEAKRKNPIVRSILDPNFQEGKPNESVNRIINQMVREKVFNAKHHVTDLGQKIRNQTNNIAKALTFLQEYNMMATRVFSIMARIHRDYYGLLKPITGSKGYILTGHDLTKIREVGKLLSSRLKKIIIATEKRDDKIPTENSKNLKGSHTLLALQEPLQNYVVDALTRIKEGKRLSANVTYSYTEEKVKINKKFVVDYNVHEILKSNDWIDTLISIVETGYVSSGLFKSILHLSYDALDDLVGQKEFTFTQELVDSLSNEMKELFNSVPENNKNDKNKTVPNDNDESFFDILTRVKTGEMSKLSLNALIISCFATSTKKLYDEAEDDEERLAELDSTITNYIKDLNKNAIELNKEYKRLRNLFLTEASKTLGTQYKNKHRRGPAKKEKKDDTPEFITRRFNKQKSPSRSGKQFASTGKSRSTRLSRA